MKDWPWRKQPKVYSVWCYLLEEACGTERDQLFKGERITLKPGQLITGRKMISAMTGVSESGVQRILNMLESEQQMTQQKSNRNRLVTILNWEKHANGEQPKDNRKTTERQQKDTRKEVIEGKRRLKKVENNKEPYGEFVRLSQEEYDKLITDYQEQDLKTLIVEMNNYVGSTGKQYKSHYHAIRMWAGRRSLTKGGGEVVAPF